MGLTVDLEKKWLYWLVRSYDGSELHRAPTADSIPPGVNEVCIILSHFTILYIYFLFMLDFGNMRYLCFLHGNSESFFDQTLIYAT